MGDLPQGEVRLKGERKEKRQKERKRKHRKTCKRGVERVLEEAVHFRERTETLNPLVFQRSRTS
ncbi:MAG: hypothetical protein WBH57_01280, partial [Anaerolineae bacterium]